MSDSEFFLACLRDPRLAAHATSVRPAWLWSVDGARVLWTNACGAALLGAANAAELRARSFGESDEARVQIVRLGATLPRNAKPRLERLRGFGGGLGRLLTCACSSITLGEQVPAVLIAAIERAGPDFALPERVRRLYAAVGAPIAVFTADGALLYADEMLEPLPGDKTLAGLGAGSLAAEALRAGCAQGVIGGVAASLERIGFSAATVLMAVLAKPPSAARPVQEPVQEIVPPMPSRPSLDPPQKAPQGGALAATAVEPSGPQDIGNEAAHGVDPPSVRREPKASAAAARPSERRHPLRFVWQMDGDGCFTLGSEEFAQLVGPRTAAVLGQSWEAIAAALELDPTGQVARAAASRDTWSGITVAWPVNDSKERLAVELSGLPVFDRQRTFRGYRGFGVCRDLARLSALARRRDTAERPRAAPAAATEEAAPTEGRPILTIVPQARNVVPFRASASDLRSPLLSPVERKAFRELAQQLSARLGATSADQGTVPLAASDDTPGRTAEAVPHRPMADMPAQTTETIAANGPSLPAPKAHPSAPPRRVADRGEDEPPRADQAPAPAEARTILDDVPVGVLIYRLSDLLYANRAFLTWAGYEDLNALAIAGGLDALLVEPSRARPEVDGGKLLAITSGRSDQGPAEARLLTVSWDGEPALMLIIASPLVDDRRGTDAALRDAPIKAPELEAVLDTVPDGIIVLDGTGRILASNASARTLFGYDAQEIIGHPFTDLFAPESHRAARDALDALPRNGTASRGDDGRELTGRRSNGSLIPLLMSLSRVGEAAQKSCAVFRDLSSWKAVQEELRGARRQAERAASAKVDYLAKISHEIRTPLNAIIGFSEVMIEERFGPIGNERYREYLRDIHASGGGLIALINDLLDLSKIEAGKLELSLARLLLNDLTQQCVAIMQSQANRARIIIRTSLSTRLPPVIADARSVRQILLNLLANSIKLTSAGGQVIVSTALSDTGEVVLRVRDTGIGMSERDIQTALEPFRALATSASGGPGGTGVGLPLTKALAEANGASFTITSVVNSGTLVEVAFPPAQVLAE